MITYRKSRVEDVEAIIDVNIKTWQTAYKGIIDDHLLHGLNDNRQAKVDKFKEEFGTREAGGRLIMQIVAEVDGQVVGFINFGSNRDDVNVPEARMAEVFAIYILESHQKLGIGRALIKEAANELMRSGLYDKLVIWTLKDNPSRGFYERLGGKQTYMKKISIGDQTLDEVGYLYSSLDMLT